ncbi:MAG: diacylglycerol kinase [Streptococcaceae bacterium]|jgi:diacylglycerol kinase (ATP)|nr:diacylglycerol kinase [Streptococcaceae bacterium]
MRARVIYNPTSGKELMKKYLADVLNELEQMGYETSAFATTPQKNSAKNEAKRAALDGFNLIVAAGGDGTINEVVNGIAPLPHRPRMAIIPAGTTNDFARALKIPRRTPLEAIKVVAKNQTVNMDIGLAGKEHYFINIAAGGGLTELTFEVPSELKTTFGYLAYIAKGAEMLPRIKPINMRIRYDEKVWEGNTSMFFVGLTNSVGGFEQYAPNARLDDGYFSLLIVKSANIVEIMRLITLMINDGKHIDDKKVIYAKAKEIEIESLDDERLMINLDGDYGGDAPIVLKTLPQHIKFYANLDDISDDAVLGYDVKDDELDEAAVRFVTQYENYTKKEE